MSSDDVSSPSQHKASSSSFADVFKTLGASRRRSQSPLSPHDQAAGKPEPPPREMEGRRGSRVTFGLESLHRGSLGVNSAASSSSSDTPATPDFESVLRNLSQQQPTATAVEEAEKVSRTLQCFSADQAMAIWESGGYLIGDPASPEARKAGSRLLEVVASRQDLSLPSREAVFRSISQTTAPDAIPGRVNALVSLADHGRKLNFTEEPVLPIAASWLMPLYELTASSRSKLKRSGNTRPDGGAGWDETALGTLFQFLVDLITLQRHPPKEQDAQYLLEQVVDVCKNTRAAGDIKNSLAVFDAVISTSAVPASSFDALTQVLCNIHASVKSLAGPTSRVVRSLAKSQKQPLLVDTLHSFLSETVDDEEHNLNVIRGAVNVFSDLVGAYGQDCMPTISFDALIKSLQWSAKRNDGRLDTDILEVCLGVLQPEFVSVALPNPWTEFVQVILTCSRRVTDTSGEAVTPTPVTSPQGTSKAGAIDDVRSNISAYVSRIAMAVEALWPDLDKDHRLDAMHLFMEVHRNLNIGQSKLAMDLCREEQLCYPTHPDWIPCSKRLLQGFVLARDKQPETRVCALSTFEDAYFNNQSLDLFNDEKFVSSLLIDFAEENSHAFLEALVAFLIEVAGRSDDADDFSALVDTLSSPMKGDEKKEETTPTSVSSQSVSSPLSSADGLVPSLSNITSRGLVKLFLKALGQSSEKACLIFEKLIGIVQSPDRPADSRLTALGLLFRLRCDSAGSIYVVPTIQNDYLVGVLSRTIDATSKSPANEEGSAERTPKPDDSQGVRLAMKDPTSGPPTSSSSPTNSNNPRSLKWTSPVWTSDERNGLPGEPPSTSNGYSVAFRDETASDTDGKTVLKLNLWLESVIAILQREKDWDVYSYVLAHLSPQLSNRDLFRNAIPQIKLLRSVLCEQIKNGSFHEPLGWTGVKKGDIAVCILESLTMLVSFHQHFAKSEQDEIVRSFMLGIGSWEGTSRGCIHALAVCCHEMPLSVTKALSAILDKMSKVITRSHIAVHILEFLALLARLPSVYVNLRDEEIRTVFGICVRFVQTSREQRRQSADHSGSRSNSVQSRLSGGAKEIASTPASDPQKSKSADNISRYVYYLTYHVMVFWFLSLKLQDRANHVSWIMKRLIFTDENGKDVIEEQSQVLIDFMQRVAYSDLGDTIPFDKFPPSDADGPVSKKSWIIGMSMLTVESAGSTGLSQITKRQASGTTYAMYQQRTAPVLPHQIPSSPDGHSLSEDSYSRASILPAHVLLQIATSAFPTPSSMQPLPLPDDDFTRRAISTFDRNDVVDGHKVGVIYIGEGQMDEAAILANTSGSRDYELFLSGLGTKVSIKDAKFNTQGLHSDTDGEFTYAWRDRVSEVIYHVTTMMPTNLDSDPQCIYKKQHVGNDFVNIIFNRSNKPVPLDTIRSQFNFVNIVVTPTSRIATSSPSDDQPQPETTTVDLDVETFNHNLYIVQVISRPDFPHQSASAIPKVISGKSLAAFVRLTALNASGFSLVVNRGDEYVSSWQNRLREIRRLRDRAYAASERGTDTGAEILYSTSTGSGALGAGSGAGARRNTKTDESSSSAAAGAGVSSRGANLSGEKSAAEGENNNVFQDLDFSRWS